MFGLPTPEEVREAQKRKLFTRQSQTAHGYAGEMIGKALGYGLRGLFGMESPQEQRAAKIQGIQQKVSNELGLPTTQQGLFDYSQRLSGELLKAGELELGYNLMERAAKLRPEGIEEVMPDTQKAIRGYIIKTREAQENKAGRMVESMTRITDLGAAAKKGNRSARGTMLQQVARLAQEAGVVTDRDAAAVAGDMKATALLLSAVLPGVKPDMKAALRGLDPLGPGFNTDELLNVANNLLTSGRETVNNRMADLREQAEATKFKPQGIKAMFAGSRNINALNKLGTQKTDKSSMSDEEYQRRKAALK